MIACAPGTLRIDTRAILARAREVLGPCREQPVCVEARWLGSNSTSAALDSLRWAVNRAAGIASVRHVGGPAALCERLRAGLDFDELSPEAPLPAGPEDAPAGAPPDFNATGKALVAAAQRLVFDPAPHPAGGPLVAVEGTTAFPQPQTEGGTAPGSLETDPAGEPSASTQFFNLTRRAISDALLRALLRHLIGRRLLEDDGWDRLWTFALHPKHKATPAIVTLAWLQLLDIADLVTSTAGTVTLSGEDGEPRIVDGPWAYAFLAGNTAYLLARPLVGTDAEGRFHREDGPAIEWEDGTRRWFWHGIEVPERVILAPESYEPREFFREPNAAVRAVLLERHGLDWLLTSGRARLLDEDRDSGGPRRLYALQVTSRERIHVIELLCPSTGRRYVLRVDPACSSCREAVAWSFGMTPERYAPAMES